MPRENLWMDSGGRVKAIFIHRLRPVSRDFITSQKPRQRIEAQGVRELFTKRAVSY